tara:strand:+ start:525 stop:1550 length:1026 start_codon:yes stop_codon:yes gene_type:complete
MMSFKNKKFLITGGTGSFGSATINKLLKEKVGEVVIFSRDEKKQHDLRLLHKGNKKLNFIVGDIRDYESIKMALSGIDYVFHAAALKQVPTAEIFPIEALKTNTIGAENLIKASKNSSVKKIVFLSTDKAVSPVNAMGMTKALMEKIVISNSIILKKQKSNLKLCITRYGNVLGSRGSLLTVFKKQIQTKKPITITDLNMTRFVMTMDEAIDLVFFAFKNGENGDLFVRKAPSATVETYLKSFLMLKKLKNYPFKIIGSRYGEKKHESLLNSEEYNLSINKKKYFIKKLLTDQSQQSSFFEKGKIGLSNTKDYNSNNTKMCSVNELYKIFKNSKILDFLDE